MGCFWPNYIMFELRKYRGVMFDGNECWCKIWRKIDSCFQSWDEKFGKLSPEHLKVSKLGIWYDFFSRKCLSLKFKRDSFVMTMKNDVKLEEEFTFVSKLTWGLWWILAWALENLNNLLFNGLSLTKSYYVRVKKVQRSYVWWHLILMQNLKKTDFCFINVWRNLRNFHQNT